MKISKILLLSLFLALNSLVKSHAFLVVSDADPYFSTLVNKEIKLMREGKRGVVCKTLMDRIDRSSTTTTIEPLTRDEKTWHPNDRKGTRSHVVPLDTKIRGSARKIPISVILYLHPSRIDPALSLFKL